MKRCILFSLSLLLWNSFALADEKNGHMDIYFIDVEGGAATFIVTPEGESILIDSGYPDNNGRDRDRILHVAKEVAGRKQIDHAVVSHWHLDHFGNHAALASVIPIKHFWDRGIPETLMEDPKFPEKAEAYRAAAQNASKPLKAGDKIPLEGAIQAKVLTASGEVIPNEGPKNPFADSNTPKPDDPSDNAKSLSVLFTFGEFTFLCCGDLTWNTEAKLVTPNNPVGEVELFMVTHHGLNVSNNPVFVKAINPHVTVMCNGPMKGGDIETQKTLKSLPRLEASYQLHRNVRLKKEEQTPAELIANDADTEACRGVFIKASIAPEGREYTVQIGMDGKPRKFQTLREK